MTMRSQTFVLTLFFLVAVTMSGCAGSPGVNFYTLTPVAQSGGAVPAGTPLSVAVSPVTMPELVDRPQLVKRLEGSRVLILEAQRWAEPLKSAIPRLLAGNLSLLLGTDRVSAYPQSAANEADFRVFVDFRRFEASEEVVIMEALFSIRRSQDAPVQTGSSHVREPIGGAGYEEMVSAYNRALVVLSKDIAGAIGAALAAP